MDEPWDVFACFHNVVCSCDVDGVECVFFFASECDECGCVDDEVCACEVIVQVVLDDVCLSDLGSFDGAGVFVEDGDAVFVF